MSSSTSSPSEILLTRVAEGDERALDELLKQYRPYVWRIVDARLEPDLRVRIDPSDVVQETLTVASHRIDDFLQRRPTTFRIWLRRKVLEQLVDARRRHFAQKRDVRRERQIGSGSSLAIAGNLLGDKASGIAQRKELLEKVEDAISNLSENDQEILLMRHGEGLSNEEAATVLDIELKAASKRYGRAVRRLASELKRRGL